MGPLSILLCMKIAKPSWRQYICLVSKMVMEVNANHTSDEYFKASLSRLSDPLRQGMPNHTMPVG